MFETNQITRLAVIVFKEEGQIRISGQGMLKRVFLSAYLSENGQQLQPPREHFYFHKNSHSGIDPGLVRKVSTYFILTESEAEDQVRRWEMMIKETAKENVVRFGEYGSFRFDGHLDFISDSLYYYQWLPSVPYRSRGADFQEYSLIKKAHPEPIINTSPGRKRKILVPALWTVLVSLFAFAAFLWSKPLNLLINQNKEMNSRLVNVAPESYSINNSSDYFTDTHDMTMIDRDSEPKEKYGKNDMTDSIHKYLPENDGKKSAASKSLPAPVEKTGKDVAIPIENKTGVSPRCTLIVGAFADPDNVDRMITRLGDLDLEVVTMERKTITLVGASISCADHQRISMLREQIEANAWMYKN